MSVRGAPLLFIRWTYEQSGRRLVDASRSRQECDGDLHSEGVREASLRSVERV